MTSSRGIVNYGGIRAGDRVRVVRGRGKSSVGTVIRLAGMVYVELDYGVGVAVGLGLFFFSDLAKLSPLELLAEVG